MIETKAQSVSNAAHICGVGTWNFLEVLLLYWVADDLTYTRNNASASIVDKTYHCTSAHPGEFSSSLHGEECKSCTTLNKTPWSYLLEGDRCTSRTLTRWSHETHEFWIAPLTYFFEDRNMVDLFKELHDAPIRRKFWRFGPRVPSSSQVVDDHQDLESLPTRHFVTKYICQHAKPKFS